MFSYSQEILVENGWIFQTIRDISDDIGKPKTYNAPCLQISLQLNIQFQLIPKNADVRAGQRMGTVKWGTRKAGYIGLCPEGIAWLVPCGTQRERGHSQPFQVGLRTHSLECGALTVNIILLNTCVTSSSNRKLQLCVYFGIKQNERQATVQPDLFNSPSQQYPYHHQCQYHQKLSLFSSNVQLIISIPVLSTVIFVPATLSQWPWLRC